MYFYIFFYLVKEKARACARGVAAAAGYLFASASTASRAAAGSVRRPSVGGAAPPRVLSYGPKPILWHRSDGVAPALSSRVDSSRSGAVRSSR